MEKMYSLDEAINALDLTPGSGGWYNGVCPHPDHDDQNPSFSMTLNKEKGRLRSYCHVCTDQKAVFLAAIDVIRTFHAEGNKEEQQEAESVVADDSIDPASSKEFKQEIAKEIWEQAEFDTDIVQGYLKNRGLSGIVPDSIRQAYLEYTPRSGTKFPVMLAEVTDNAGNITGIHRTFLSKDENGNVSKATVDSPKKALGAIKGNSVHLSDDYENILYLTEGVETALAVQEVLGVPVQAVLSANNLSSVVIPDDVKEVWIWADLDRSGTGEKSAKIAAQKFVKEGKKVFILLPQADILDGKKSVDWLDMGAEEIINASRHPTEFHVDPWGEITLPEGYIINQSGVFFEKETKSGVKLIPVTTGAMWLSRKRIDLASNETELEVSWFVSEKNTVLSRWLNRGQLLKKSTMLGMVELESFPAYDGIHGESVKYLALQEQVNQLKTDLIVRNPGWTKNIAGDQVFITGHGQLKTQDVLFHPESAYQSYADALKPSGDFEEWLQAVRPMVKKFPIVLFALLAVLCAPLLRILVAPNFIVDFWGRTSVGKTSLLQVLASVWGKPSGTGGLILSWNNTITFSERLAAFFGKGLPLFFDDSQTATDRLVEVITYMVANGTGKGRAKPYSLKETDTFQVVMFATGEKPLTEKSYPGAKARVIEINGSPFPEIDPTMLHGLKTVIVQNYGHLGDLFITRMLEYEANRLCDVHEYYLQQYTEKATNEIGYRFASYFAPIRIAGVVLASIPQMRWIEPLIDDALEILWDQTTVVMDETDMSQRALQGIAAWIESNRGHFSSPGAPTEQEPTFGMIKAKDGFVAIIPHIFNQALQTLGVPSSAAVLAEWKKKEILIFTPGRNQKQIKIGIRPVWCVCIQYDALFPEIDGEQATAPSTLIDVDDTQPTLPN